MEKCCECGKIFSTVSNLRKHARKFHPDKVKHVAPKKQFTYRCEPCKKNFNLLRDFTYHKKRHSTEVAMKKSVAKLNCALCQFNATKAELLVHFENEHNLQLKTDILEFNSSEEFVEWKKKLETSTWTKFVKQRGNFCTNNNKTIIKYVCHRSGNFVSKAKDLRHLKSQGSHKINGFCPACIKVEIIDNKYQVSSISQHVGHQQELKHLSVTSEERETLANQMVLKVPFTEILDQVRDSVQGSQLERIHLLTRRDPLKIEKSFNAHLADNRLFVDVNLTSNEVDGILTGLDGCNSRMPKKEASANESKVTKEKEKIITKLIPNLIKLVANISYIEQVEAFKKLCAPIAPTLLAIARRHEEIKKPSVPSDSLFGPHT